MAQADTAAVPRFTMAGEMAPYAQSIRASVEAHAHCDGFFPTAVPGLQFIRASANCHLVVSQNLPVIGQVVEASASDPYLCLHLRIEEAEVNQIVLDHGMPPEPAGATAEAARGLYTEPSTPALMNAIARLVELLNTPQDIAAIAPLIRREIVYRLLFSPYGWRIARTASPDCNDQRIARAIRLLQARFREPVSVAELAGVAHLSASALHLNFKAVTSLTPLQYLKQLRLQEARRLLLSANKDAAAIAFEIGYESPSQFSREYARLFGQPPGRDRQRLLGAPGINSTL